MRTRTGECLHALLRSINSPDQAVDFVHVGIQFEGEARPVKILQPRGMFGEERETGFFGQVHLPFFHIAVVQSVMRQSKSANCTKATNPACSTDFSGEW